MEHLIPDQAGTCGCETCVAMREAAAEGERPTGVPLRIYGGYLEARAALRANAPAVATRVLEWLLSHLAEERGARPDLGFAAKVAKLKSDGAISPNLQSALIEQALSAEDKSEKAWALLSITEHAFYRLYLRRS